MPRLEQESEVSMVQAKKPMQDVSESMEEEGKRGRQESVKSENDREELENLLKELLA